MNSQVNIYYIFLTVIKLQDRIIIIYNAKPQSHPLAIIKAGELTDQNSFR